MKLKQFLGLQIFEFAYLMALAFLPFFVAQREVGLTILMVAFVYILISAIKFALTRQISVINKVVLVTGCDSGFGKALARRLSSQGVTVVAGCLDKSSDGAQELKSNTKGNIHILQLDISDEDSVESCVSYIKQQFPEQGLWALVNNAGILYRGDIEFSSVDVYKKVADVNLFGTIRMTKACLPLLRAAKGRVINVIGASGRISLPHMSAFCVSNFGLEAFSDALRLEMSQFGVKVVVVEPGNYYGSTGLQNRAALPEINKAMTEMWSSTSEEVQVAYDKDYIERQYRAIQEHSKTAASSLAPVIDTLEMAVLQARVRVRYLVDGSNQLSDFLNLLIRWKCWLPEQFVDKLVARYYLLRSSSTAL